jgi:phage terminase small subunit
LRKSKPTVPKPPAGLSDEARAEWRRLFLEYDLNEAGALALLRPGIHQLERAIRARKLLDAEGEVTRDRWHQAKVHPAAAVERDALAGWRQTLRALQLDVEPLHDRPGRPGGR